MSDLPYGWADARLDAIASVNPPPLRDLGDDDVVSFVPMASVEAETGRLDPSERRVFAAVRGKSYRSFTEGDVLFAKVTPCMENGKIALATGLANGLGFGSSEFHIVRACSGISAKFLMHFLLQKRFRDDAKRDMSGTAGLLRVSSRFLESSAIPVPPGAEQVRIVAAIEEQFSWLDAGVAALDAAFGKAGTLAKAAMEAAVSSWDQVPLREVLSSLRNGIFVSRPGTAPTRRAILRISAVRPLRLDAAEVRYVPESTTLGNEDAFRIDAGDLLFTRYNGNADLVGACALVGAEAAGMLYPDKLIRAVVNKGRAMPDYLEIALNCGPSLRAIAERRKTTAGQVGISGSQLLSVPVPLPPLADQERMVAQTRSVLDAVRRLRLETARARRRCEGLRSAVLAAAFSGKLVPQNPDDEPAPVLLERIAAERASANGHKTANVPKPRTTRPKVSV